MRQIHVLYIHDSWWFETNNEITIFSSRYWHAESNAKNYKCRFLNEKKWFQVCSLVKKTQLSKGYNFQSTGCPRNNLPKRKLYISTALWPNELIFFWWYRRLPSFYSHINSLLIHFKSSIIYFRRKLAFFPGTFISSQQQKIEVYLKSYWQTLFCRAFSVDHFGKKSVHSHQEMTVLESKYRKTWNRADPSNMTFSSILILVPSFPDENRNFFYQNDQQKKFYKNRIFQ
jgi:hypothetical protein